MKKTFPIFIAITCFILISPMVSTIGSAQSNDATAESMDVSAGEKLYQKNCRNCHGPTAKGMASFPKLAGKSAEYISERLLQYRAGEMLGPNTPLMRPQAVNLSDEDIANVANYISNEFE